MKKIKFMLLSLALVAVVGGALAFKARYTQTFCTTFAQLSNNGIYTCTPNGIGLTCPTKISGKLTADPIPDQRPVCTAPLMANQTCGNLANPNNCGTAATVTITDN